MGSNTSSVATTRLDHIRLNLAAVRQRVGDRLVLAAVKANAYGHGAVAVSRMIEATGAADWLGVAHVSEGLDLRRAGVRLPILKLSVARGDEVGQAIASGITLTVTDEASILEAGHSATALGEVAEIHLKLDTGMGRIGRRPDAAPRLAALAAKTAGVRLSGVFSHLPVADMPSQDRFTADQQRLFGEAANLVEAAVGPVIKHLANSAGVLAHPGSWFDMVRPGIMIYGAYPDPACPHTVALEPGMEWTTTVSFIKRVRPGETVGYGRTWTATEETRVATIPVGYGDGYSRRLSNRGRVLINNRSYPIVGRVCMDQSMINLGPTTNVAVGDPVILLGRSSSDRITTDDLAELMETIPYEVTCLLTPRVVRESIEVPGEGA
ncbi:alanine racemase [Propionicicella superfundia]|uniref:alanine racemase n=1 Tax=Propionicicella superfundia TaxID=348582 RepID=UPI000405B1E3|nr:alanine racemase [Propionicicella superfundia]